MTWDHSRGYDPMVATAAQYAKDHPGVSISWDRRSLQAFADRPIDQMADEYDLMVIDHPHVGEAARSGLLLALDGCGHDADLAALAEQSVGASHRSYAYDGHHWALAIDAATPVASYRPDLIEGPPADWSGVLELARAGRVAFALIPINALMTFFGLARTRGFAVGESDDELIARERGVQILEEMREIASLVDARCFELDPIGVLEWMGRTAEAPAYCPFGYGYANYSRDGYCAHPLVFADAPGIKAGEPGITVLGGTGIAVSATTAHRAQAVDYACWIASAACQAGMYFDAGGQPGNAVAWESDRINAASRDFFRNTRSTLEAAWLRPRYDGYMRLQDAAGDIVHDCVRGRIGCGEAWERMQAAYAQSIA